MNARAPLFLVAAALLCGAGAQAACPPGQTRHCSNVDLNVMPEVTQQIISREPVAPAPKKAAPADAVPAQPYTGPTIGVSDQVRRAATIGYRWSTD